MAQTAKRSIKAPGTEEERQQALAMVAAGYSYRQIARILGRGDATIRRWAQAAEDEVREMHEQLKREFAAAAWAKVFDLLGRMTPEKLDRLNPRDAAWVLGVLFDKAMAAMSTNRLAEVAQKQQENGNDDKPEPRITIVIDEKVAQKLRERRSKENETFRAGEKHEKVMA